MEHVSFELWEVKFKPNNDLQDFDQPDYFDYYERCTKLDPSHFDFYYLKDYQRFFPHETKVIFQQVQMENQYILRLCPAKAGTTYFMYTQCWKSSSEGKKVQPIVLLDYDFGI